LSKFVDDAVLWRMLGETLTTIKPRNAGADPNDLLKRIDTRYATRAAARTAPRGRRRRGIDQYKIT
jgi:hypothetical protein